MDGFETAMAEGGKMRLRVPAHSARLTADCKQIKSVVLGYFWHKGKLVSRDKNQFNTEIPEASRVHPVIFYSKGFRLLSEASVDTTEAWRFGHAVPHRKYPLEFYPRY